MAVDVGFTSDIRLDGVAHHNYNEPHVGVPSTGTLEDHVKRIIQNHLLAWDGAKIDTLVITLPDVNIVPVEPPQPTPEQAEIAAFQALIKTYTSEKAAFDKGFVKTDTAMVAAKKAMTDFYDASLFQGSLKVFLASASI